MFTLVPGPSILFAPADRIEDRQPATPANGATDWSNVVFAAAFCEQTRRDYEDKLAS